MSWTTSALTWVDEVQPTIVQHGDWENPDERIEFGGMGLSPTMVARLDRLAGEQMDEGVCEAEGCGTAVGYVLHEDDENPARSGWQWHWTTVIDLNDARTAIVVCEECAPSNFYRFQET